MPRSGTPQLFRVLLQVADLAASRRFYERLLDTLGRDVRGGRVYFDAGPVILALVDPSTEGTDRPRAIPEPLYLSTANLEGAHRRAQELNCLDPGRVHEDPAGAIVVRPWGERSFYARDPSGNPLCFVDSRTLFTGLSRRRPTRSHGAPRRRRPRD